MPWESDCSLHDIVWDSSFIVLRLFLKIWHFHDYGLSVQINENVGHIDCESIEERDGLIRTTPRQNEIVNELDDLNKRIVSLTVSRNGGLDVDKGSDHKDFAL